MRERADAWQLCKDGGDIKVFEIKSWFKTL
jgi:hypothetical protein